MRKSIVLGMVTILFFAAVMVLQDYNKAYAVQIKGNSEIIFK